MGIEAAIIGSAIIGGVGSAVGAKKSSQAAKTAANAQTQAADEQARLAREIYYDQRGLHQPYYQAGLQGLYGPSGVMALMGMGGGQGGAPTPQQQQPNMQGMQQNAFAPNIVGVGGGGFMQGGAGQPMVQMGGGNAFAPQQPQSGPDWQAYLQANPDVAQHFQQVRNMPHLRNQGITTPEQFAEYHYNTHGKSEGRQLPTIQPQQQPAAAPQPVGTPEVAPVPGAADPATPAAPSEGPMTQTLRQTPGYQFLQDESTRALENSFAARGKLLSGSAMKALQERSMGLADQTYGAAVDRALQLTNIGQGGAAQITNAGNNYGAMAGNAFANMGNARAQGAIGQANAFNQGMQGMYGAAMGGLGAYGAYRGWSS